jgi:hypothetical protein
VIGLDIQALQYVIGITSDENSLILKSDQITYIKDAVADDGYTGYSISPDGTGIIFFVQNLPNETFLVRTNFIQLSKINNIINGRILEENIKKVLTIGQYLKIGKFKFGIKVIGVAQKLHSDKQIYDNCIKNQFIENINLNNINLDGIGLRISHQMDNTYINQYIEPYFKDKSLLYSIIDANSLEADEFDAYSICNSSVKILDLYNKGLNFFRKE